jgi:hypothetical protein
VLLARFCSDAIAKYSETARRAIFEKEGAGVAKTLVARSPQVAETTIRLFINSGVAKSNVFARRCPLQNRQPGTLPTQTFSTAAALQKISGFMPLSYSAIRLSHSSLVASQSSEGWTRPSTGCPRTKLPQPACSPFFSQDGRVRSMKLF